MKGYVNLTHTNNSAIEKVSQKVDEMQDDYISKDTTELTNYYTKSQTYSKEEIDNKTANVYRAKGSVQTYQDLPTTNNQVGDVYNVIEAYNDYPAGTNFVWTDTSTWDALGGEMTVIQGVSQEDFDKLINNETQIYDSNTRCFLAGNANDGTGYDCILIGNGARSLLNQAVMIGNGSGGIHAGNAVCIGHNAKVNTNEGVRPTNVIQIGTGTNTTSNSLQIRDDNIYKTDTHTLTVQNAEINGTPAYGVLSGTSAPTTSTVGAVGQFYLDTTNKQLYQCMSITTENIDDVDTNVYEWEKVDNGTTVNVNNIAQSSLNFDSDPQAQIYTKVDKNVNDLVNYTLSTNVGSKIQLSINTTNYIMTVALLNADDDVLSTQTIDFPLESMVVGANYANGTLTLTLQNGQTLNVNISDIIDGLVPESRTINGKPLSNNITLTNTDVGAPSVNDLNNGLENKVDKVSGKQLSTNDYTTAEKNKLAGIESGAQVNNPIDNEFSTTSINSLQNRVITNKINQLDTSVSQNTENIELIKTYKLNRDPTLLWEGIANTNTNITLSFSITNFTWIYFTATNESNERCTQIVLRSDLQETDYDYPYNIAASHSDVARYINLYPMNNTHLTIKGVENMTLNRVYGI